MRAQEIKDGAEAAANVGDGLPVSLIEKAEQLVGVTGEFKSLQCDCDTYKCHCKKQCFCKLQEKPFTGTPVPHPPTGRAGQQADAPSVPDHEFKCTCSFDGIGGPGASMGGTMDCDCKVADCTCDRQCLCRAGGATAGFKFREAGGELEAVDVEEEGGEGGAAAPGGDAAAAGEAAADAEGGVADDGSREVMELDSNTY